jgi:hypothetical protein
MNNQKSNIMFVIIMVTLTAMWRVCCSQFNLFHIVPVASIGLFSGSILNNKKWAYLIPIGTMLLSDILFAIFTNIQGFYGLPQFINYAALACVTYLGTQLQNRNRINVVAFTLSGSMIFFLLSNFGTFLSGYYGFSFQGLVNCYAMAIPFIKNNIATKFFVNSFVADFTFSCIAFSMYYFATQQKTIFKMV